MCCVLKDAMKSDNFHGVITVQKEKKNNRTRAIDFPIILLYPNIFRFFLFVKATHLKHSKMKRDLHRFKMGNDKSTHFSLDCIVSKSD